MANPFIKREGDTTMLQRRVEETEGSHLSELLTNLKKSTEPLPPEREEREFVAPHQRPQKEDMLQELKEVLDDSRQDAELRRLASIVFHLRYDLLKRFCTDVGSTPDKVHSWSSNMLHPPKSRNEEAK